jgi:hypothetical protein
MPEFFLWTKIINPITTAAEYRKMLDLMLKARVQFELPVSTIPAVLLDAVHAWNSQAMALQHVPGWNADPVGVGVLIVRQYKGGQLLWKSQPYPADVVARAFKDLDVPHLQVDRELMEARLENHLIVPYWERQA